MHGSPAVLSQRHICGAGHTYLHGPIGELATALRILAEDLEKRPEHDRAGQPRYWRIRGLRRQYHLPLMPL